MKALESLGYLKPNHFKDYIIFNYLKSKYYRILKFFASVVYLLLSGGMLVMGILKQNETLLWVAAAILLFYALIIYTINRNVKAVVRKNKPLPQHVKFGKNGFIFNIISKKESENEHYEVTFDEIQKIYDAPNAIYIYINKKSVIIIPKEYLCCSVAEAKKYLASYCPPKKLVTCI